MQLFKVKKEESGLEVNSKLKIPHMRAVDKARMKKHIGSLNDAVNVQVENAVRLHLGME